MRHEKGFEVHFGRLEKDLYAIGDARDWAKDQEGRFLHYLDMLERGAVSFNQVRQYTHDDFVNVNKNIDEWEGMFAEDAIQVQFPYLHDSLRIGRVAAPLPDQPA